MTPQLESIFESLQVNKIPEQWQRISYASEKCFASYFNDFCDRLKWIQNWWMIGEMPQKYWLSAFFCPRSFLKSIKLNFAREHNVPLEEITIDFTVVNDER